MNVDSGNSGRPPEESNLPRDESWNTEDDQERADFLLRDADPLGDVEANAGVRASSDTSGSDEVRALYRIARDVGGTLDLDTLLPRILELALEYAGAERGILFEFDSKSGQPRPWVVRGMDAEEVLEAQRYSLTILDEARKRLTVISDDAMRDERFQDAESVALHKIRSVICLPIGTVDRVIGALYLDNLESGKRLGTSAARFAGILVGLAAAAIGNAEKFGKVSLQYERLRREMDHMSGFDEIVGRSKPMVELLETIGRVAPTDFPVLLHGESGTGKELLARALHRSSRRADGPFIVQNCAAIPSELLESEFFGHARGAFTGAHVAREGLFRLADRGTLFLDEIGDLDPRLQAKLLRALEDGVIRPVGSVQEHRVSFRLISASSADLEHSVREGRFRQDLFYRLNVVILQIPPLRERTADIPVLLNHFLGKHSVQAAGREVRFTDGAMRELQRWPWKGNVRELEHFAKRVLVLSENAMVGEEDLPRFLALGESTEEPIDLPLGKMTLAEMEAWMIKEALHRTGGNKVRAAELLGIHRSAFQRRLEKLDNGDSRGR